MHMQKYFNTEMKGLSRKKVQISFFFSSGYVNKKYIIKAIWVKMVLLFGL